MSRANIYIRKENEAAWDKIENKSDWVNDHLKLVVAPGTYRGEKLYVDEQTVKAGVSVSGSDSDGVGNLVPQQGKKVVGESTSPGQSAEQQPAKKDICKEHGVPKDTCKLMKHK